MNPQALYAPLSDTTSAWRNCNVPSAEAPVRSSKWIGWRVRLPMNSSSRVIASFTGRRAARASIAVMKSWASMSIFPPKLPAHRGLPHVDAAPVQAEAVGQLLAVHEHHVHRADHLEAALGVEAGDQHVRLDRRGRLPGGWSSFPER